MIYFTSYANQKFDILNKHGIFITKEQVEDAISSPDKTTKKGRNILIRRDDLGVAYV
ncbi:hypothetical protein HGA64_04950, partial [Candidatus Falkowbacteria bacterium]|nr:hypothetical protein [Candidatus Falkowbacteria bacterium]